MPRFLTSSSPTRKTSLECTTYSLEGSFSEMPLTPDEISELLSQPLLGHIAVVKGGRPHVTPIWVYYDRGLFYITTRLSRVKGKAISENGTVAISIATNERPYRAVIVEGEDRVVEKNKLELLS